MFPKCLVFSDRNIFIRTYSKKFLVFPVSRFLRANTQWEYCLKIDPFLPKAGVGCLSMGVKRPCCPCRPVIQGKEHPHFFFFLRYGFR